MRASEKPQQHLPSRERRCSASVCKRTEPTLGTATGGSADSVAFTATHTASRPLKPIDPPSSSFPQVSPQTGIAGIAGISGFPAGQPSRRLKPPRIAQREWRETGYESCCSSNSHAATGCLGCSIIFKSDPCANSVWPRSPANAIWSASRRDCHHNCLARTCNLGADHAEYSSHRRPAIIDAKTAASCCC